MYFIPFLYLFNFLCIFMAREFLERISFKSHISKTLSGENVNGLENVL